MKHFAVKMGNGEIVTLEVYDWETPEGWLAAVRADGKKVTLNGTTYLTPEIAGVEEVQPRAGSTNMDGV